MLQRVLIANRGEIAVRIAHACRDLGISSVAVCSDPDEYAPHVRAADEYINIGPASSSQSYLVGEKLIQAAILCGADAIHPGYGFLSERASFAEMTRSAGLVFVGPPTSAIEVMGHKTTARSLMIQAGVPVVPGTTEPVANLDEAMAIADSYGYPVLLKAAAGGGGRGMRVVRTEKEMQSALSSAEREALNAFGDGSIYIEKYIEGPRHIEVQILADSYGNTVHLGERECSLQRRHQKMLEEAPSVAVGSELRECLGATSVKAAQAVSYENAGTCEYLLDKNGDFWFLEMNTRIQVEHPVTELVTGIDLVEWQLRIASGEKLAFNQSQIQQRGCAIECRITSEDSRNGFLPSTGSITHLRIPSGVGVRWDSGIEEGSEIGLHYDPMLAKLIVHAPTREIAISRMIRALTELAVGGVETSRDFLIRLLEHADVRSGNFDIQWLEKNMEYVIASGPCDSTIELAAVVAALTEHKERNAHFSLNCEDKEFVSSEKTSAWRSAGRREGRGFA